MLRKGIATVINDEPDMQVVGEASNAQEAVEQFRKHRPDVTLMDLRLPDTSGIEAMRAIQAEFPGARIIVVTTFEGDAEIQRALEAGAHGYLLKNMPPDELVASIRHVYAGKKRIPSQLAARLAEHLSDEALTTREVEVLRLLAEGNRNLEIAERLFVSEKTIKAHVQHIMEKLGAKDRTQAVAVGIRRGIIHL